MDIGGGGNCPRQHLERLVTRRMSHIDDAMRYADEVLDGTIPACAYVRLACERFRDDLAAAEAGTSTWEFRPDLAEKPIKATELFKHVKGPLTGKPLLLLPWQKFVVANLFGFVERGTTTRRYRQAVIYVCRAAGKSSMMAPLLLYLAFMEGEGGAECYVAATTRDQAKIVFDMAHRMIRDAPDARRVLGIEPLAHSIIQRRTGSKLLPLSSDAKSLEGLSVHGAVLDEIASHNDGGAVYSSILTATSKRQHPLIISISTATDNHHGIGRQLWDYAARVLKGDQQDERLFGILYTIDETDDPWVESSWQKAAPSWGHAVQPDAVRAIMQQARNNPAQEAAAKTRQLNVWVGADEALFSTRAWRACADPTLTLDDFEGQECELAVDLASRIDLASIAIVFPSVDADGRNVYSCFGRHYINEAAVQEARNPMYPTWAASGDLIITPGNETDFQTIEADIFALCRRFQVRSCGFDPWAATMLSQRCMAEGINMVEMRQGVSVMSEPTKELQAAMQAGRIRHTGDQVLTWAVGNVVGTYDKNDNVKPNRSREEAKIDPAIALIMAIGRCMVTPDISGDLLVLL